MEAYLEGVLGGDGELTIGHHAADRETVLVNAVVGVAGLFHHGASGPGHVAR